MPRPGEQQSSALSSYQLPSPLHIGGLSGTAELDTQQVAPSGACSRCLTSPAATQTVTPFTSCSTASGMSRSSGGCRLPASPIERVLAGCLQPPLDLDMSPVVAPDVLAITVCVAAGEVAYAPEPSAGPLS